MKVDELTTNFIKTTDGQPDDYMDGDNVDLVNLPRKQKRFIDHDFYMKSLEREIDDDLREK